MATFAFSSILILIFGTLLYFALIHYYVSYMTTNAILKSKRISSPVKSLRWSCSSRVAFWGTPEKNIFTIDIFEQNVKSMHLLKWNNLFLPQFVHSLSKAELIRNWGNFETNLILELLAVTLLTTSNFQEILDYKIFKFFIFILSGNDKEQNRLKGRVPIIKMEI